MGSLLRCLLTAIGRAAVNLLNVRQRLIRPFLRQSLRRPRKVTNRNIEPLRPSACSALSAVAPAEGSKASRQGNARPVTYLLSSPALIPLSTMYCLRDSPLAFVGKCTLVAMARSELSCRVGSPRQMSRPAKIISKPRWQFSDSCDCSPAPTSDFTFFTLGADRDVPTASAFTLTCFASSLVLLLTDDERLLLTDDDGPFLDGRLLLDELGRDAAAASLGSSIDLGRRSLGTVCISLDTEPLGIGVLVSGARSGVVGARAIDTFSMSLSICLAAAARSVGTGVFGTFSPRRCTQAASTLSPRRSKSSVCGERLRDAALSCLTPCGNLRPAGDGLLCAGLALSSTVGRTADRERPGERPRALSVAVRGRPKWLGGGGSGDSSRSPQVDAAAPVDAEPPQYV
jgi:hypothetical protein